MKRRINFVSGFEISIVNNNDYSFGVDLMNRQNDGKKVQNIALDKRLGSSVFNDLICPTCNLDGADCQGHFGFIKLQKPIFNMIFLKYIKLYLQIICNRCGQFLNDQYFTKFKTNMDKIVFLTDYGKQSIKTICQNQDCNQIQGKVTQVIQDNIPIFKVTYDEKQFIQYDRSNKQFVKELILDSQNIYDLFTKVDQTKLLKYLNIDYNLSDLLFGKYFPIPSTHIRTQLNPDTFNTEKIYQNQLTQLYQSLIKSLTNGLFNLSDIYNYIQQIFGEKVNESQNKNIQNSFKDKLNTKTGLIRQFIMQSRSDNTARAVIGCSVDIDIDEILVSEKILKNISIPTKVTQKNIKLLQYLVDNKNNYPGANMIQKNTNGKLMKFLLKNSTNIKLDIDDIVHRNPLPGERCFLNRMPTLHLYAFTYFKIKPIKENVIQLNNAITKMLQADFDGDETNLIFLVNQQNIIGSKIHATFERRMTNLADNSLVLVPNHDTPFGIYIFTKEALNKIFTRKDVLFLFNRQINDDILEIKKTYKGIELWNYLIPLQFRLINKEQPIYTNKDLQKLFLNYYYYFGAKKTKQFMQNIQLFAFRIIVLFSKTLTIDMCEAKIDTKKLQKQFIKEDQQFKLKYENYVINNINEKQQQITNTMNKETMMISDQYNKIFEEQSKEALSQDKDNIYMYMINSGSKGSFNHILSLQHLGQQLEGQDIFTKYANDRYCAYYSTLPGLRENNIIFDGLYKGINSQSDYISQQSFARINFVTQKFITATPGYINRRLDQFLSCISVSYHNNLLINNQFLLSMCFANNQIDLKYQRRQTLQILKLNNQQIKDNFDNNDKISKIIIKLRDKFRYQFIHGFNQYIIQDQCYFPINFEDIIIKHKAIHKSEVIDINLYHKGVNVIIDQINYIANNDQQNPELQKQLQQLDNQYKQLLQLIIYDKLNYKLLKEHKISLNQFAAIIQEIISLYYSYKLQPGEHIGLQCSQAFSKDITQKIIDSFHKTNSKNQIKIKVDWLNQLDNYLTQGKKLVNMSFYRLKQNKPQIMQNIKQEIQSKKMQDIYESFITGYDLNDDKLNNYYQNDVLNINQSKLTNKSITKCSKLFIEIQYSQDTTEIQLQQYSFYIANYLINNIKEDKIYELMLKYNLYILYNSIDKRVQIRFNTDIKFISQINEIFQQIINKVDMKQKYLNEYIKTIYVEDYERLQFDKQGDINKSTEQVLQIYDEIQDHFFLKYNKDIDYSRSEFNILNNSDLSIVIKQRILHKNIQISSMQLIGNEQLPQNVSLISQLMCHKNFIIPISRYKIKNIYGADTLYITSFEQQYNNLVKGSIIQQNGDNKNNYTSYFLSNSCQTGINKSEIILLNKQKNYNIEKITINVSYFKFEIPKKGLDLDLSFLI